MSGSRDNQHVTYVARFYTNPSELSSLERSFFRVMFVDQPTRAQIRALSSNVTTVRFMVSPSMDDLGFLPPTVMSVEVAAPFSSVILGMRPGIEVKLYDPSTNQYKKSDLVRNNEGTMKRKAEDDIEKGESKSARTEEAEQVHNGMDWDFSTSDDIDLEGIPETNIFIISSDTPVSAIRRINPSISTVRFVVDEESREPFSHQVHALPEHIKKVQVNSVAFGAMWPWVDRHTLEVLNRKTGKYESWEKALKRDKELSEQTQRRANRSIMTPNTPTPGFYQSPQREDLSHSRGEKQTKHTKPKKK